MPSGIHTVDFDYDLRAFRVDSQKHLADAKCISNFVISYKIKGIWRGGGAYCLNQDFQD